MVLFDQICTKGQDLRLAPLSQHVLKSFFEGGGLFNLCLYSHGESPSHVSDGSTIYLMKLFNGVPVTLICTDRLHHVSVVQTSHVLACAAGFTHVYENLI